MKKIAITLGDPNGISPEITIKALNFLDLPKDKIVLIANDDIFNFYEKNYNLSLEKNYETVEIPFNIKDLKPGFESEEAGEFAFRTIIEACKLAYDKKIDAIVTAPVSKNAMKMAGHKYDGQTEILEQYLARTDQKAEMLFVCEKFSLLLMTRHIALNDVTKMITKSSIIEKVKRLNNSLINQFGKTNPKLAICALNPHAGENGMFGTTELTEIIPAVEELQNSGINIEGPFPADALFARCALDECDYDCYIAMYHDQGLIPIKLLARDNCVNTTIGLDVIRTSPAHGTAFDIAGKNIANASSMIKAITAALN